MFPRKLQPIPMNDMFLKQIFLFLLPKWINIHNKAQYNSNLIIKHRIVRCTLKFIWILSPGWWKYLLVLLNV